MSKSGVAVLGIFVVDLAFRAGNMPAIGETIAGSGFAMGPGGKGSNQAVAAARAGAEVTFVSRIGADEAEILSIALDPNQRGRGFSRDLLLQHLGHLAGRGVRTVFLEVEENNQPARRLYERAGFATVGRRERYYLQPGGEQLNALLMRRDLS